MPDAAWDIYMAPAVAGGFGERQRLDAISTRGEWNEADPTHDWEFNPEISPDGQTLLFTSLRPGGHGFGDIYVSRRGPRGWGQPVNLGPVVNTAADEFHPTLSRRCGTWSGQGSARHRDVTGACPRSYTCAAWAWTAFAVSRKWRKVLTRPCSSNSYRWISWSRIVRPVLRTVSS